MKRLFLILVLVAASLSGNAQSFDELAEKFLQHYETGQYEKAITTGNQLLLYLEEDEKLHLEDENYNIFKGSFLSLMAFCLDYLGEYERAIEFGTQATDIFKNSLGENHPRYALSLSNLANYYSGLGDYTKAIELGTKAMEIGKAVLGENHPDYAASLNNLAKYYSDLGDYAKAIELGTQAMEIRKAVLGENHPNYANSLSNLAGYYSNLGDYAKAIELQAKALEIHKDVLGENHPDYANSLSNLAGYYARLGNYTKAIELGTQALEIRKVVLGEDHPQYAHSLNNLAGYYSDLGDYAKAIELGTKATEIFKNSLGENHPYYATTLNNLATNYAYLGDYAKAIELGTQAMEIRKAVLGENHPDYATSLSNLAIYYSDLGDYAKAIELGTQALKIRKAVLGENHPDYALSLGNLASYYSYLGNYTKAIELGTQALEICKSTLGENHPHYACSLNNLAGDYSDLGDFAKAIELGTQALEISKSTLGENHPDYATSLSNLAGYYSDLGDFAKAIELGTQALEIRKATLGVNHPDYATSLSNLAKYYPDLGDYAKAIELGTKATEIFKNSLGENHPYYAASLSNLASDYASLGNYTKAIELGTKALEIQKAILGENHPDYATSLNNLAGCYADLGNYAKAIELETQTIEILKSALGEERPNYALSLSNLALEYLWGNHDIPKATALYREAIGVEQRFLYNTLSGLSATQRLIFWEKYKDGFQSLYPSLASLQPTDSIVADLYDKSCLFSKGILLSAETEMRKLVLESGDKHALDKFDELQATRSWLNKLYEQPIAERHVNTDSLENVAERLETELVRMSKTYGDFMHNLKLTWKDVQAKLGDKDIAVEFLSFPVLNSDSTMYIALTVRTGYNAPHMVRLFEENELKSIKSSHYKSPELSKLVWGKMADELEGIENIYFSPSGELYNIGIESMPHWADSCMMSDRYNLYRLSSTRELAINRSETKSSGAVVYGGIQYDTDVAEMGIPKTGTDALYAYRGFDADSTNYRGTHWDYLPGTLAEAEEVTSIIGNANTTVSKMTGSTATETSFKELSGQKKNVLHIATHGFYWSEEKAERERHFDRLRFLQMGDERPRYVEDKAMTRSGLLFAGANNTFNGVEIPAGVDDGVLTAQEIAQLDLRGLDLLVLSACQTGLGEIKGEGVFGLQRGFKKAGAQSIMMSLWTVDDQATKDLMTQFYTALTAGKTKREAFIQAQQYLKDHDTSNLRNKRPHWAAFILLDATE